MTGGRGRVRGIPEAKRLEVLELYLRGHSTDKIVEETGISKGSVIGILQEARAGKFAQLTLGQRVDELHKLSVRLKKEGIDLPQARLGLTFWRRLEEVGVEPEEIESLIELHHDISSAGFPKEDFLDACLTLLRLRKEGLFNFSQVKEKGNILEELSSLLTEVERELAEKRSHLSQLAHEFEEGEKKMENLQARKRNLEEEITEGEEVLSSLSEIGFGREWLKELKGKVEEVGKGFGVKPKNVACSLISDIDLILRKEGQKLALDEEIQRLTVEIEDKRREREELCSTILKEEARRQEISREKERIEASIDEVKKRGLESIQDIRERATASLEGIKGGIDLLADEALNKGKEIGEIETKIKGGAALLGDFFGFLRNPRFVDYESTKELVTHLFSCTRTWMLGHREQIEKDPEMNQKLPRL
jgi:DNA repair exonuclease SbcCD ATPase subunit